MVARVRRQPEHYSDATQQTSGFRKGGEAEQRARAAGRWQRVGDAAPAGADSPAAAPGATGARGVTRHTSPCSISPAKRLRGQSIITVEELDQEPAAAAPAAAAAGAPLARGLQRNHIRLYMHQNNVSAELAGMPAVRGVQ